MTDQKSWVKLHKKEFAEKLIEKSGAIPDGRPTAIFMAGLPGAGKTELSRALVYIAGSKVVRIDMDEIATKIKGYSPKRADLFRGGASELLNKTFDIVVSRGLDFIMDGTFSSKDAKINVARVIKRNYVVKIIYVYQDPKLAWNFTKEREKIEHRAIDKDGFIESYFNTIDNIKEITTDFGDRISLDVIIKDDYNKIKEWLHNTEYSEIDKNIKKYYNKDILRNYIDD